MKLSIVIPTYNYDCTPLVRKLHEQLPEDCEIIVADDGSTDSSVKEALNAISCLSGCSLYTSPDNVGRSRIRNRLTQLASGTFLLLLDSDVVITDDDFVSRYLQLTQREARHIYVGRLTLPDVCPEGAELRWKYEKKYFDNPLQKLELRTCNCLIPRQLLLDNPFNEDITCYGHEDTLLGVILEQKGYSIEDSQITAEMGGIERNREFLLKSREAIGVLKKYSSTLSSHSRLIALANRIQNLHLSLIFRFSFRILRPLIEMQIYSTHPNVTLFQLWKLGEYLNAHAD